MGDFIESLKKMMIALGKKIKDLWNAVFSRNKKSEPYSKEISSKISSSSSKSSNKFDIYVLDTNKIKNAFNANSSSVLKTEAFVDKRIEEILSDKKNISNDMSELRKEAFLKFSSNVLGTDISLKNTTDIKKYVDGNMTINKHIDGTESVKLMGDFYCGNGYKDIESIGDSITSIVQKTIPGMLSDMDNNSFIKGISAKLEGTNMTKDNIIKFKSSIMSDYVSGLNSLNSYIMGLSNQQYKHVKDVADPYIKKDLVSVVGEDEANRMYEASAKREKEFKEKLDKAGKAQMDKIRKQMGDEKSKLDV